MLRFEKGCPIGISPEKSQFLQTNFFTNSKMFESCNVSNFLDHIDMNVADLPSQVSLRPEGSEIIIQFKPSTKDAIVKELKLLSMKTNASGGQWPDPVHLESSLESAQAFLDSAADWEDSTITFETESGWTLIFC